MRCTLVKLKKISFGLKPIRLYRLITHYYHPWQITIAMILASLDPFVLRNWFSLTTIQSANPNMTAPWAQSPNMIANMNGNVIIVNRAENKKTKKSQAYGIGKCWPQLTFASLDLIYSLLRAIYWIFHQCEWAFVHSSIGLHSSSFFLSFFSVLALNVKHLPKMI